MTAAVEIDEVIAEALESVGLSVKRRQDGWVVPVCGRLNREIVLTPEGDALRVRAVLVEWDEIGPGEALALDRFLERANAGLRFAHCEREPTRAVVTALVDAVRLADAIGGVAAGCRMLAREAGALLGPEAARVYLEFHG
jgi:hypothetical protein